MTNSDEARVQGSTFRRIGTTMGVGAESITRQRTVEVCRCACCEFLSPLWRILLAPLAMSRAFGPRRVAPRLLRRNRASVWEGGSLLVAEPSGGISAVAPGMPSTTVLEAAFSDPPTSALDVAARLPRTQRGVVAVVVAVGGVRGGAAPSAVVHIGRSTG